MKVLLEILNLFLLSLPPFTPILLTRFFPLPPLTITSLSLSSLSLSLSLSLCRYCCLASDFWSLGAMVYQMACGKMGFRAATEFLTFEKVKTVLFLFLFLFLSLFCYCCLFLLSLFGISNKCFSFSLSLSSPLQGEFEWPINVDDMSKECRDLIKGWFFPSSSSSFFSFSSSLSPLFFFSFFSFSSLPFYILL